MNTGVVRRNRTAVVGTAFVLLALPAVLAAVEAARYYARNRHTHTILSSGVERQYVLYVPESYDPVTPTPLVFSLHGAGLWGAAQRAMSQWDDVADREGIIVVYPSGGDGDGPRVWEAMGGDAIVRDVRFFADLIDTLSAEYNIDSSRIYANGLSNGGGMSFVLSCTMSDRIAAVGLVAAARTLPFEWCTDERPVPVIAFHGTGDWMVPFDGGLMPKPFNPHGLVFPDVRRWTAGWAGRNGCDADPLESAVAPDVTRLDYPGCAEGAPVVLYVIDGGGHTWPGSGWLPEWFLGYTTESVDATEEMWEFFRAHPLRAAP